MASGEEVMAETIPALFIEQVAACGSRPLFFAKRGGTYQSISWHRAAEDVLALSSVLIHRQVAVGDRVLILSENRPEWGIADLAIQSIGAWTVPVYPSLGEQDLLVICRDCQPVVCIASTADQAKKLFTVAGTVHSIRLIIVMDAGTVTYEQTIPWAQALADGAQMQTKLKDLLESRRTHLRPDDTATLIYTSGTTGEPKGVRLSHRNFLFNVDACLQVIPVTSTDLHLSFLPLCHVFERMAGWYLMLTAGASVAYAEDMDTIPQNMLEIHPTVMLGVPRFFEKLYARIQEGIRQAPAGKRRLAEWALRVGRRVATLQQARQPIPMSLTAQRWLAQRLVFKKLQTRLGGRLRFFVSGGAPLSKEIGEFFYSLGVTIIEGYGLTETSPVITVNRLATPRFGTVGPVVPGVELRVAEDGEVLTKGPHVMQGYYQKPEATAAAIHDGWLHTGDIGHLDTEHCLVITDRKKDLIKTAGGKFVAPQKLENLFVTDPAISQAFIYGDTQPYCVALIVPNMEYLRRYAESHGRSGASVDQLLHDPQVIQLYWDRVQAKQHGLANFEQVKKIALLSHEFSQASGELTPTLKAKRGIIAARYDQVLRRLYQVASPAA